MSISEKAAYLKGLADGLELDANEKSTKVINGILDLLADLTGIVDDIDESVTAIDQRLDEVDEDLGTLEDEVYSKDECFDDFCDCHHDYDFDDDCCGCGCDCCDDEDGEDIFELDCPACGKTIYFDDSIFDEDAEVECPECGATLEGIFLDEDEEDK